MTLPHTVEELTAEWLTGALRQRVPDIEVSSIRITHIEWGTATKVLLRAEYTNAPEAGGPPESLCVKGSFCKDGDSIPEVSDTGSRDEARFFQEIGRQLDMPLPTYWYAGADESRGIVVFDDLVARGVRFGDPTEPWPPDLVARGLEVLATQHGTTWNRAFPEVEWLTVGAPVVRFAVDALFSAPHWDAHFAEAPKLPAELTDRERSLRAYAALWALDDAAVHCLCHGDAHIGNTYLESGGRALFLDWASPCLAPWSYDVAYFITGALTPEDRRADERALLDRYLAALAGQGGPALDRDAAWADYVRHQLHGLIWANVPPIMQSPANVQAMAERHTTAIIDNDTLRALGV